MPADVAVWLDFADPWRTDPTQGRLRVHLRQPLQVWRAHSAADLAPMLAQVQAQAQAGRWCVGWLAYEAAPALDAKLPVHPAAAAPPTGQPPALLGWWAAFAHAQAWPADQPCGPQRSAAAAIAADTATAIVAPQGPARADFEAAFAAVQQAITQGEVYQVNLTAAWHARLLGDVWALAQRLARAQPGGYLACIDQGDAQVLSYSPELFFDWDGTRLLTRPMKGTAARGADAQADAQAAQDLRASAKERAENVMIVDLLRNDCARVAQPHSVQVPRLLDLQALPSVWQMTSDVVARTRTGTRLSDVLGALFPCGSVTGAPKRRAMHWISTLESAPRGVYCGALGVLRPGGHATFNVPIRTLQVQGDALRWHLGSGITHDAQPAAEWAEWQHKGAFIERAAQPFELLETLRLDHGRIAWLDLHLQRLARSAAHFGYPWAPERVEAALQTASQAHPQGLWRLRLRLDAWGRIGLDVDTQKPTQTPVQLALAATPFIASQSEFTRYKTTRRAPYDAAAAQHPEAWDVVLHNAAGALTETTRTNLALLIDGRWLTPAASCGLLAGVARAQALRAGWLHEAVLHLDDLNRVQGLACGNALRGWLPARLRYASGQILPASPPCACSGPCC